MDDGPCQHPELSERALLIVYGDAWDHRVGIDRGRPGCITTGPRPFVKRYRSRAWRAFIAQCPRLAIVRGTEEHPRIRLDDVPEQVCIERDRIQLKYLRESHRYFHQALFRTLKASKTGEVLPRGGEGKVENFFVVSPASPCRSVT